jgi:CMP-2-keto-3-deoxyoctulosonic acid synthetase
MAGYTKDFLVDAFMSRYVSCNAITIEQLERLEQMAIDLYDRVGRDQFRIYACLDSEAIRTYKASQ